MSPSRRLNRLRDSTRDLIGGPNRELRKRGSYQSILSHPRVESISNYIGGAVGVSDVDTVVTMASEYTTVVWLAVLGPPSSCIVALGKTKSRFAQNLASSSEVPKTSNG